MSLQRFGIYVHIPYCLQRCSYCDFATYVHSEIKPPEYYVSLVKKEIQNRTSFFAPKSLDTLYFGGGTPSLLRAHLIVELISELAKYGYRTGPQTEVTIEINPATIDEEKLNVYLNAGVNRFSVGAQTFSDRLLKSVKREHNAAQTVETLKLLRKYDLNFSFDVLFALPTQTLAELKYDLSVAMEMGAKHISPYCLTVPEGHLLSKNRPLEDEQIEMFNLIHSELTQNSFQRYEISNYALPGFESQHNKLYWTDQEYWGLGLSAHSYSKKNPFGIRFWNLNSFDLYSQQITSEAEQNLVQYYDNQKEELLLHQALTDFCHVSFRLSRGLILSEVERKFGPSHAEQVLSLATPLITKKLIVLNNGALTLTDEGIHISNQVFEVFTFLS